MANFYLVCGISGGGKTVLTERIVKKNPHLKIFDVDKYYEKINGDECIRENKFKVWWTMFADIHEAEEKGEDVILTTNALVYTDRADFVSWFPSFKHHLLWVISPYDKCVEGNKMRKRHVPDEILEKHWHMMEIPSENEKGWDTITHITNCWDNENYIICKLKGNIEELIKI